MWIKLGKGFSTFIRETDDNEKNNSVWKGGDVWNCSAPRLQMEGCALAINVEYNITIYIQLKQLYYSRGTVHQSKHRNGLNDSIIDDDIVATENKCKRHLK